MINALAGKIAGAAVVAVVIGTLWLKLQVAEASEEAAVAQAEVDRVEWSAALTKAEEAAAANAATVETLTTELQRREQIMAGFQQDARAARLKAEARLTALREATIDAPDDYTACTLVPVPSGVLDVLRQHAAASSTPAEDRHQDGDGVRPPESSAPAAL